MVGGWRRRKGFINRNVNNLNSMRICCAVIPRFMLLGLLSLSSAMKVSAQASAPSAGAVSQQPAAANVRGQVADPSGALIPGVKITMTTDAGGEVASVV